MAFEWPEGAQSILSALGFSWAPSIPVVAPTDHADGDQGAGATMTDNPSQDDSIFSHLGNLSSTGDISTILTRFLQFSAFGTFLQFLGISETIRWLWSSLYEYVIGRFVLRVHFEGDEMPYL